MNFRKILASCNDWLSSEVGVTFRSISFSIMVTGYPIFSLIANGPLIRTSFPLRYNVDDNLPDHLKMIATEQKYIWLERETRQDKNTIVKFYCQTDAKRCDSVSQGGNRFYSGAHIALPFYARFSSVEEAREYCKKHFQPFKYMGKTVCVVWDAPANEKLLQTMVLSKSALQFLITRELYSVNGFMPLLNKVLCWACYTGCACVFAIFFGDWFLKSSFFTFLISVTLIFGSAVIGSYQYHYLYKYLTDFRADQMAGKLSDDHWRGGKEYYAKMMLRNRLLREMMGDDGKKLFLKSGDLRSVGASPIIKRFNSLLGIIAETDYVSGESLYTADDLELQLEKEFLKI